MTLVNPLWLLAAGAIIVPLVLHLWGRGNPRPIRVGNTHLIAVSTERRRRRLRPSELLLLLLRALLLFAVALAMAGPRRLVSSAGGSAVLEWILVDPEMVAERAAHEGDNREAYARLDALLARGLPARALVPGLPALGENAHGPVRLWPALAEAAIAAPEATLHVFSFDRLETLDGIRPPVANPMVWTTLTTGMPAVWIESTDAVRDERRSTLLGVSDAERTRFEHHDLDRLHARVAIDGHTFELGPATSRSTASIPIDIRSGPDRVADVAYLRAALAAVASAAGLALVVTESAPDETGPGGAGLVFWLSDAPPPQAVLTPLAAGGILVRDAEPPWEKCDRVAHAPPAGQVRLSRCVQPTPAASSEWRDDHGSALLDSEANGRGVVYRLHTRLDPLWSDLVFQPLFPEWLFDLLERVRSPAGLPPRPPDRRVASPSQRSPSDAPRGSPPPARDDRPEHGMWLAVAALLATERAVARARERR